MRRPVPALVVVVALGSVADAGDAKSVVDGPLLRPGEVLAQPNELPAIEGLRLYPATYPRTSGSTSAEPMGVWIACRILQRKVHWLSRGDGGQVHLLPWTCRCDEATPATEAQLLLRLEGRYTDRYGSELYSKTQHDGTHGAYVKLIHGEVPLIYECRLPSEDELNLMKEAGVELDIRPIALDAFVFLKHSNNEVTGLTLDQVKDIYTAAEGNKGRITHWRQIGGADAEITPYVRNRNSGSQETMMNLVMKDRTILGGRSIEGYTMAGPYNNLYRDANGLGYTFFYYQRYMAPVSEYEDLGGKGRAVVWRPSVQGGESRARAHRVEMLAVDGVMPSRATVADGSYPLVTRVYAAIRKDMDPHHSAVKLRDWLLTPEGQRVIGESGYVPLRAEEAALGM